MTTPRPAPYPPDTRAKGWRFELDLEQVMQSDTWALAAPELRPWLFMLWTTAWQQTPCGSMPSDDALIAARLGMPMALYAQAKAVLLRGWWQADDGRLYHDTITARVLDMLARKAGERKRKADYRARMEAERKAAESGNVPRDTTGTDAGRTWESHGCDATGTETGTGLGTEVRSTPARALVAPPVPGTQGAAPAPDDDPAGFVPTPAGAACRAMKAAGFGSPNPSDPRLKAMLEQGVTVDEFVSVAKEAAQGGKGWPWVLRVVQNRRAEAARIDVPSRPVPAWHETKAGVIDRGKAVGMLWREDGWINGEHMSFPAFKARVMALAATKGATP